MQAIFLPVIKSLLLSPHSGTHLWRQDVVRFTDPSQVGQRRSSPNVLFFFRERKNNWYERSIAVSIGMRQKCVLPHICHHRNTGTAGLKDQHWPVNIEKKKEAPANRLWETGDF